MSLDTTGTVCSGCSSQSTSLEAKERGRSPAQIPFLFVSKLYSMLQDCDKDPDGKGSIVSWVSEGRAFRVHKRKLFVETILPSYFNQTKYKSFQRQLNLWGFDRIVKNGLEKGAYYHMHFLRDEPLVIHKMRRVRAIKKVPAKERRRRQALFQQPKEQSPSGRARTLSECDNNTLVSGTVSSLSSRSTRGDDDDDDDHFDNRERDDTNLLSLLPSEGSSSWSFMVLDGETSFPHHPRYAPSSTAWETCTTVVTACSTILPSGRSRGDSDDKEEEDEEGDREPDFQRSGVDDAIDGKELDAMFMASEYGAPSSNKEMLLEEAQDEVSMLSASSSLSSLLDEFIPLFPID